jgi:hypothetical protein
MKRLRHSGAGGRTGAITAVLLLVTTAAVLILALVYHLGLAATAVAVLVGLPALWMAWVPYHEDQRKRAQVLTLDEAADQLAAATRAQWEKEAAVRRLNDPYPLPVSWTAADPALTDRWELLERLARSGAGWPARGNPGTWGSGPDDLAGKDDELIDALAKVPTRRLLVLGEPGSGKTMLMVRLVLDLLADRKPGGPVPVLVPLASWNPEEESLHAWLGAQLVIDHTALTAAAPAGTEEGTVADALLAERRILPLLDGLDEIPDVVRGRTISRINDSLRPGEPVVVTCRTQQYRHAVRPPGDVEVTLRGAAAVELRSLDAAAVAGYLRTAAGGPISETRWDAVLADLGRQSPVGQALTTPLMVGLARAIYNPRLGESARELPDPAELTRHAFADRAAVERYLFDAFIPASYRPGPASRWTSQEAERWLVFLACHLERTIKGPDLAWWQLSRAMPRGLAGVVAGAVCGVIAGVLTAAAFGAISGVMGGAVVGATASLIVGAGILLFVGWQHGAVQRPSRRIRLNAWAVVATTMAGLGIGALLRAAFGVSFMVIGLITGFGFVTGLNAALRGVPDNHVSAASPQLVLARDRRAALVQMFVPLIDASLLLGGLWSLYVGFAVGVVSGLTLGVVIGLGFAFMEASWPSFVLTRGWLAVRRRLPWSLIDFLGHAHSRGVLRQVGAVYQFRHIELQHRLATRHTIDRPDQPAVTSSSARADSHLQPP